MEKGNSGVQQSNRGTVHGGMQAGGDNSRQIMSNQTVSSPEEQLSQQDILELLGELEQKISESDIPADVKDKTIYTSRTKEVLANILRLNRMRKLLVTQQVLI